MNIEGITSKLQKAIGQERTEAGRTWKNTILAVPYGQVIRALAIRLTPMEDGPPVRGLKSRIVIGNIKCKQNYSPDDKAFHSSDVPDAARAARLHAKAWKRPKTLGGVTPPWNSDSSSGKPLCVRVGSQLIIPAHKLPKEAPPPHEGEAGWSSSTQLTVKEVAAKVHWAWGGGRERKGTLCRIVSVSGGSV